MEMTRRGFLCGMVSAAMFSRLYGEATSEPLVKIGFLSDAHINPMTPNATKAFEAALRRFAEIGVDVVVSGGDLLDMGTCEEMQVAIDAWRRVFPEGRARDGRPVAPFFVWGNHDYMQASFMRRMSPAQLKGAFPETMIASKDRWWRELTGGPFPGEVFHRKIRGVSFVGANWGHENKSAAWMTAHAGEIDMTQPFIHVEHPHPARTVCGEPNGPEAVSAFLAKHPNCLSLSGHTHYPLTGKHAYWHKTFTALTGSIPSAHTSVISVYSDRFVIAPHNMKTNSPLPEWVATLEPVV